MKMPLRLTIATSALFLLLTSFSGRAAEPKTPRVELTADPGWKFSLGDPGGAETVTFPDSAWRTVDLPHDWSIEARPEKSNPSGSGGGFFPAGVGWYRKSFSAPPAWQGKRVSVEFDGVYRDATVYLNGQKLGTHPYGYTSFTFDLTSNLNFAGPSVLAVRVDNSAQPNSRWYSGSGSIGMCGLWLQILRTSRIGGCSLRRRPFPSHRRRCRYKRRWPMNRRNRLG